MQGGRDDNHSPRLAKIRGVATRLAAVPSFDASVEEEGDKQGEEEGSDGG